MIEIWKTEFSKQTTEGFKVTLFQANTKKVNMDSQTLLLHKDTGLPGLFPMFYKDFAKFFE